MVKPRARALGLLRIWLGVVVAGCGSGGGTHGHWTDPGARLIDGMWIGPQTTCPPGGSCAPITDAARAGLSDTERSQVVRIARVALPTHFMTDEGEPRAPSPGVGIVRWAAALVTLADGRQRVVGLGCWAEKCEPMSLPDWQDGAVWPSGTQGPPGHPRIVPPAYPVDSDLIGR